MEPKTALPRGWRLARISDVADVNPENLGATTPPGFAFRYIDLSSVARGTIRWLDTRSMMFSEAPSRARRIVRAGDILFGTVRPALQSHGSIQDSNHDMLVASTGFAVLRAKPGISSPRFLFHYILSEGASGEARKAEVGSSYPAVSESDVRRFALLAPSPPEQSCIAKVLDAADEAILKTEQLVAKLKQMKQGLLHDLLTRGIDENGRLRDPERTPEQFKDSPLGRIPNDWEAQPVEALLANVEPAMRSGPFGSALLKSELVESGVPLLGIDNVQVERFISSYTRFLSHAKAAELRRYRVRPNDVMITIMGTVGRCCIVPNHVEHALSSKHVWTLSFDRERYSSLLACLQINYAPWVLRHLRRDEQGGIMSAVRSETLRSMLLPVPPMAEALEIERIFATLSRRIEYEQQEASKLRLLKHGLMDDLLTGRVRVTPLLAEPPP